MPNDIKNNSKYDQHMGDECQCSSCQTKITANAFINMNYKAISQSAKMQDNSNDPFEIFTLFEQELEELQKIFEQNLEDHLPKQTGTAPDAPPPIPKEKEKKYRYKPEECNWHSWEKTGSGPVSGQPWFNCVYCGIAREKVEK